MIFDPISKVVFNGLLSALINHKKLGQKGKIKSKKNIFGDMALRADIEAEERISLELSNFAVNYNYKILCFSEELGEQVFNPKGKSKLFAVFDGLDGSGNYVKSGEFGYGTMLSIADTNNPSYKDFIVSGLAMMEENKIVISQKGKGVKVYDSVKDSFTDFKNFIKNEKFNDKKVLANKYFPEELSAYGHKLWTMTGSTAWSIYTLCTDDRFNGLIEVTRKGNLEQPVLYSMITELGGVMIDKNGKPIGSRKFKKWGQSRDGEEFLITAKSLLIAKKILESINI